MKSSSYIYLYLSNSFQTHMKIYTTEGVWPDKNVIFTDVKKGVNCIFMQLGKFPKLAKTHFFILQ